MNTASVQIFFWSLICLSPADCCGFGAYRGGPFPRPRSFEGGRRERGSPWHGRAPSLEMHLGAGPALTRPLLDLCVSRGQTPRGPSRFCPQRPSNRFVPARNC